MWTVLSGRLGEARSQPGVGKGSDTGPMMGGFRVALRTLSVECLSLRVSDPRLYWHHCAEDTEVNIMFVQDGAQEPQSGFLDRRRAGGAGGGGWRLQGLGFLPEQGLAACCGADHGRLGPGQGSAALRGARPRDAGQSDVGLMTPFSDVDKLLALLARDTSRAFVFMRQSAKAFGRMSCDFDVMVVVDTDPEVDSLFALKRTLLLRAPCIWQSLPLIRQSTEASGRTSRIFCVKVNSDPGLVPEVDSRLLELFAHALCPGAPRMIGGVGFLLHFAAFFALRPDGRECPFFSPKALAAVSARELREVPESLEVLLPGDSVHVCTINAPMTLTWTHC